MLQAQDIYLSLINGLFNTGHQGIPVAQILHFFLSYLCAYGLLQAAPSAAITFTVYEAIISWMAADELRRLGSSGGRGQ